MSSTSAETLVMSSPLLLDKEEMNVPLVTDVCSFPTSVSVVMPPVKFTAYCICTPPSSCLLVFLTVTPDTVDGFTPSTPDTVSMMAEENLGVDAWLRVTPVMVYDTGESGRKAERSTRRERRQENRKIVRRGGKCASDMKVIMRNKNNSDVNNDGDDDSKKNKKNIEIARIVGVTCEARMLVKYETVGTRVGVEEDGLADGLKEGDEEGLWVGRRVGDEDGTGVGAAEGAEEGA